MSNQLKSNSSKPKPSIEIPVSQVAQGIELCKQNITDFLEDARNIMDKGKLYHAYVSFEFALEEFGKIVMLKEALASSSANGKILASNQIFTNHKGKCQKAIEKLGPEFKSIYHGDWFLAMIIGMWPLSFGGTVVSHQTRLNCAFVDYKNNAWAIGAQIDQAKFTRLINELDQKTKLE